MASGEDLLLSGRKIGSWEGGGDLGHPTGKEGGGKVGFGTRPL